MPCCTKFQYYCLKKLGVKFGAKRPRYLSAKIWIDGGGYSTISIGSGVTISSLTRLLTHDWALDTIYEGIFSERCDPPIGKKDKIVIGDYSFIGTGCIILPGVEIGKCCLIGAGTVVRGKIPDYSIVVGNPGVITGDTRKYLTTILEKKYNKTVNIL